MLKQSNIAKRSRRTSAIKAFGTIKTLKYWLSTTVEERSIASLFTAKWNKLGLLRIEANSRLSPFDPSRDIGQLTWSGGAIAGGSQLPLSAAYFRECLKLLSGDPVYLPFICDARLRAQTA